MGSSTPSLTWHDFFWELHQKSIGDKSWASDFANAFFNLWSISNVSGAKPIEVSEGIG
jgi:hypothetical protein